MYSRHSDYTAAEAMPGHHHHHFYSSSSATDLFAEGVHVASSLLMLDDDEDDDDDDEEEEEGGEDEDEDNTSSGNSSDDERVHDYVDSSSFASHSNSPLLLGNAFVINDDSLLSTFSETTMLFPEQISAMAPFDSLDYDEATSNMHVFDDQLLSETLQKSWREQALKDAFRTSIANMMLTQSPTLTASPAVVPQNFAAATTVSMSSIFDPNAMDGVSSTLIDSLAPLQLDEEQQPQMAVSDVTMASSSSSSSAAAAAAAKNADDVDDEEDAVGSSSLETLLCSRITLEVPTRHLAGVLNILRTVSNAFDDEVERLEFLGPDAVAEEPAYLSPEAVESALLILPQSKLLQLHELVDKIVSLNSAPAATVGVPKSVRMNSLSRLGANPEEEKLSSVPNTRPVTPSVASPEPALLAAVISGAQTPTRRGGKGSKRSSSQPNSAPASPRVPSIPTTPTKRASATPTAAGKVSSRKPSSSNKLKRSLSSAALAEPVAVLKPHFDQDSDEEIDVVGF